MEAVWTWCGGSVGLASRLWGGRNGATGGQACGWGLGHGTCEGHVFWHGTMGGVSVEEGVADENSAMNGSVAKFNVEGDGGTHVLIEQ